MADFNDLIGQAKKIQEKMKETQDAIKKIEIEGVSGGNIVRIKLNGEGELKSVYIDPKLMKEKKEVIIKLFMIMLMN